MKVSGALILAAVAVSQVEAYPRFFNGMTWANFAWEVNPKSEDLSAKDMVLVDAFDVSAASIASIKKKGNPKVVCYISAGTWESWRPDASQFPESLKKERYYSGTDREKWFDITKWDTLKPHMSRRMKMARSKGCDGIELDNQDCYINGGKCIKGPSYATLRSSQIAFAQWLADEAHRNDLAVGLKNAMEIMDTLKTKYDFAINEECAQYGECGIYKAFTGQGKAVFGIEYNGKSYCDDAQKQGISRKYKTSGGGWNDCDWMYKAREARMKKQEDDAAAAAAQSSSSNVGVIVACVIGGIACVALIAGGGFYAYKRKQSKAAAPYHDLKESTTALI